MLWGIVSVGLAAFLATALLVARGRSRRTVLLGIAASGVALTASSSDIWFQRTYERDLARDRLVQEVPERSPHEGYASSASCRPCHPSQYASWHASYHRTMTQVATSGSVLGNFENVDLELRGRHFRLSREGDEYWVSSRADGDPTGDEARTRIVMTTGSHHYQVYWGAFGSEKKLASLPFVYLLEARRWVPREDVFLAPPEEGPHATQWSNNCVGCHSTYGRLKLDGSRTDTVELGIACEACHGPGERHRQANGSPWRRYLLHFGGGADGTILQPARLPADRSSKVCGQCHSVFLYVKGADSRYRAGAELAQVRAVVRPNDPSFQKQLRDILEQRSSFLRNRFWLDGMARVAGREFSGMSQSKCYRGGKLSCLSCHSMHDSNPDDQLSPLMQGDEACFACHADYRARVTSHSHHSAASSGSRCYNCHMPYTSYGLLKAIRSHLIDNPTVESSLRSGRPNACNQCHLDRSLGWTQRYLSQWYGTPPAELNGDDRDLPASLLWLLRGDAGQRALAAWSIGWDAARRTSGEGWEAPFLAELLDDPYSAVRYIAGRSLRTLPGFGDFGYDFIGPPEDRSAARRRAIEIWKGLPPAANGRERGRALVTPQGDWDWKTVDRLRGQRDDREIFLME